MNIELMNNIISDLQSFPKIVVKKHTLQERIYFIENLEKYGEDVEVNFSGEMFFELLTLEEANDIFDEKINYNSEILNMIAKLIIVKKDITKIEIMNKNDRANFFSYIDKTEIIDIYNTDFLKNYLNEYIGYIDDVSILKQVLKDESDNLDNSEICFIIRKLIQDDEKNFEFVYTYIDCFNDMYYIDIFSLVTDDMKQIFLKLHGEDLKHYTLFISELIQSFENDELKLSNIKKYVQNWGLAEKYKVIDSFENREYIVELASNYLAYDVYRLRNLCFNHNIALFDILIKSNVKLSKNIVAEFLNDSKISYDEKIELIKANKEVVSIKKMDFSWIPEEKIIETVDYFVKDYEDLILLINNVKDENICKMLIDKFLYIIPNATSLQNRLDNKNLYSYYSELYVNSGKIKFLTCYSHLSDEEKIDELLKNLNELFQDHILWIINDIKNINLKKEIFNKLFSFLTHENIYEIIKNNCVFFENEFYQNFERFSNKEIVDIIKTVDETEKMHIMENLVKLKGIEKIVNIVNEIENDHLKLKFIEEYKKNIKFDELIKLMISFEDTDKLLIFFDKDNNKEFLKNLSIENLSKLFKKNNEYISILKSYYLEDFITYESLIYFILSSNQIEDIYEIFKENNKEFFSVKNKEECILYLDRLEEVIKSIEFSNASELSNFKRQALLTIFKTKDYKKTLIDLESIFLKNNLPLVGKKFACLDILHPDLEGFDFEANKMSPVLKKTSSPFRRKLIMFSDLIMATFGSNNKSVNDYLNNLEKFSNLYENIKSNNISFDALSNEEMLNLISFRKYLATLYNNSTIGAKDENEFLMSDNIMEDIYNLALKISPNGTVNYNLGDRLVKMFCGMAGFDSLDMAKAYIEKKIQNADAKNREQSKNQLVLEQGDIVKGVRYINYLGDILQNGSVSKEYLGDCSTSDATPLDTDVSIVLEQKKDNSDTLGPLAASGYGPIFFILKKDDRLMITRDAEKTFDFKRDLSKLEVFHTGVWGKDHSGIRTGFASSEIDCIMTKHEYDARIGLEIAMNGFYIPVVDVQGNLLFSPKDYDELREKMQGLSHYGEESYIVSPNIRNENVEILAYQIEENDRNTAYKRQKINEVLRESLKEFGLEMKTYIDGDLSEGSAEVLDTGSTGRGTNKPGDGDFDFMMRLDKSIILDGTKLKTLKEIISKNLEIVEKRAVTNVGDFRFVGVQIDDICVDIDITFVQKTNKISYSTDMALQDRLETIRKTNPENYKYVIANILLAKRVLKEVEAYKPNRGNIPQGGLGGVGIENWILQNGGSFHDAALSFVQAAEGKNFDEFKRENRIWDFGENHVAANKDFYTHDNFIYYNMSENGYKKMVDGLKKYLSNENEIIYQNEEKNESITRGGFVGIKYIFFIIILILLSIIVANIMVNVI